MACPSVLSRDQVSWLSPDTGLIAVLGACGLLGGTCGKGEGAITLLLGLKAPLHLPVSSQLLTFPAPGPGSC